MSETTMQLDVDDTTRRLIEMLRAAHQDEPERPDPGQHPDALLEEIARAHSEWSRTIGALRYLIGARLTSLSLYGSP
jgi:hypothetical protein